MADPIGRPRPPGGLEAETVEIGGQRLVVLSWPAPRPLPQTVEALLTPAERSVAQLILAGLTIAEIARVRGTSNGTVQKQIDAAYRKLGVGSRRELAARVLDTDVEG